MLQLFERIEKEEDPFNKIVEKSLLSMSVKCPQWGDSQNGECHKEFIREFQERFKLEFSS